MNEELDTHEVIDLWWRKLTNREKARCLRLAASVLGDHDIVVPADVLYEKSLELEKAA